MNLRCSTQMDTPGSWDCLSIIDIVFGILQCRAEIRGDVRPPTIWKLLPIQLHCLVGCCCHAMFGGLYEWNGGPLLVYVHLWLPENPSKVSLRERFYNPTGSYLGGLEPGGLAVWGFYLPTRIRGSNPNQSDGLIT